MFCGWLCLWPEQRVHGHDKSWGAEATLGSMCLSKPLLYRVQAIPWIPYPCISHESAYEKSICAQTFSRVEVVNQYSWRLALHIWVSDSLLHLNSCRLILTGDSDYVDLCGKHITVGLDSSWTLHCKGRCLKMMWPELALARVNLLPWIAMSMSHQILLLKCPTKHLSKEIAWTVNTFTLPLR